VNGLSRIWEKLREKAYRDAFVASQLKRGLPTQIRVMLKGRGWNQSDLAERAGLKQGAISRAADPDYGNLTINTILKIASGFDVAYIGRFVPFSDLARWYTDLSESALSVPDFLHDAGFLDRKGPTSQTATQASYASTIGATTYSRPIIGNVTMIASREECQALNGLWLVPKQSKLESIAPHKSSGDQDIGIDLVVNF
jgi:transcriptional regulator with XRE-family HTH domain